MSELNIKTPDDIRKIEGWRITRATFLGTSLKLRLYHPAADHEIDLTAHASTNMGLLGIQVVADSLLSVEIEDVENSPSRETP